jgi:hypothetical protein
VNCTKRINEVKWGHGRRGKEKLSEKYRNSDKEKIIVSFPRRTS